MLRNTFDELTFQNLDPFISTGFRMHPYCLHFRKCSLTNSGPCKRKMTFCESVSKLSDGSIDRSVER